MLIVYLCTQRYTEEEIDEDHGAILEHNKKVQELNIIITLP